MAAVPSSGGRLHGRVPGGLARLAGVRTARRDERVAGDPAEVDDRAESERAGLADHHGKAEVGDGVAGETGRARPSTGRSGGAPRSISRIAMVAIDHVGDRHEQARRGRHTGLEDLREQGRRSR